jgi:23S rRNA (adenine2503-C2)-methyltransferase
MTLPVLENLVVELGQQKYTAGYIFSFIHIRGVNDISEITSLSKLFRNQLVEQGYYISSLKTIDKLTDPDGTIKYVFGLADDGRIESVLLFDEDRKTLCISTQVGCAMGCVFCATGKLGFARDLTPGEIVDQVLKVIRDLPPVSGEVSQEPRVTNIVFMGMGEPMANYRAVLDAIRILNHSKGLNIGIRRITISTCGFPQAIEKLADEDIGPRLAISLNAPTDAIRQNLMPITKKYSLEKIFDAVEVYKSQTRNRVTFEYVLIKGVNDTVTLARMLVKRIRPFMCNVNLIEYNPHKGCDLKPSPKEAIERFARVLKDAGIETTIRFKKGQKICAACGQLGAALK